MNAKMLGLVLLVIGVLLLVYNGVEYRTHKKVLDLGPIEVTKEEKKTFPFSPVLGGVALVGGIFLVGFSRRRSV
ncbi:MAG: DUF3185 domain-containing protein [Deltaproteobacteria bacterium]|nr:DUF3185 domain-containing protein [Deltaproteobacteria bacterium]